VPAEILEAEDHALLVVPDGDRTRCGGLRRFFDGVPPGGDARRTRDCRPRESSVPSATG
jgi:hypothetical protein